METGSQEDPRKRLASIRTEIDEIDVQIANLLHRRFGLTEEIGKTKGAFGIKIKDPGREQSVLQQVEERLPNRNNYESVIRVFSSLIQESVSQQERIANLSEQSCSSDFNLRQKQKLQLSVCFLSAVPLYAFAKSANMKKNNSRIVKSLAL